MRPSSDKWKKPPFHRLWSLRGTLTTPVSAGGTAQTVQEVSGVYQWQLPMKGDWRANERTWSAGPHVYKQGRMGWGCESLGQHWPQWPWDCGVQDSGGKEQGKNRIVALDFRSADFVLFTDLLGRITKLHSNAKCSRLLYLICILNFYSATLFFIKPITYFRIILPI